MALRTLGLPAVLLACALALGGCASRPGPDALVPSLAEAPGATPRKVLVATTRARDIHPGVLFNGERGEGLDFATVTLTVPPTHKTGAIEWPRQAPGNPATDMVVHEAIYKDTDAQFVQELNAELAKRPKGQKDVFVFVHGYNTMFAEALYRLTQMAHDADATAVPVLFTWASRGKTEDYVYDNNSATAARDDLEKTLALVAQSNAEHINIMAHSMGNWVTVEALRQMKIDNSMLPPSRVGNIILAAPDIDVDVFKSQLKRFGKPAKPFVVIVSRDDKALGISDLIAGGKQRLGAYKNDAELVALGAVVVDMTDVKSEGDGLNHGKFAQLAGLRGQLRQSVEQSVAQSNGQVPGTVEFGDIQISGVTPALQFPR
ncbi:MAG: alpha/beta hydrolase [Rhizobiales bacterium]|jgi:esterase/lipase superfamily enzyme|nr:alpha/beta hydrolase [Hyphomicrobiales bacterium]